MQPPLCVFTRYFDGPALPWKVCGLWSLVAQSRGDGVTGYDTGEHRLRHSGDHGAMSGSP